MLKIQIETDDFNLTIKSLNDVTKKFLEIFSNFVNDENNQNQLNPSDYDYSYIKDITAKDNKGSRLFKKADVLANKSEYGNITLYKPIAEYILDNIQDVFTKENLRTVIIDFYKKHDWAISITTAQVYSVSYRKYLLDNGFIAEKDSVFFVVLKRNMEETKIKENINDCSSVIIDNDLKNKFWDWFKNRDVFTIDLFLKSNFNYSKEEVEDIIAFYIRDKKIFQLSNNKFKVIKK